MIDDAVIARLLDDVLGLDLPMTVLAIRSALERSAASLARMADAAERRAIAAERFNRVMELANDIDPDVQPEPPLKKGEIDPHRPWTDDEEEAYAAIETLEEAGVRVPPEAYKRLGLDPPEREDEPTADELEAEQPGSAAAGRAGQAAEQAIERLVEQGATASRHQRAAGSE